MSKDKQTGGPAFPHHVVCADGWAETQKLQGMTLRDYFAAKALEGLVTGTTTIPTAQKFAEVTYQLADAMIKAREVRDD
jgi:hypothetical protein